jgi:regulator of sigma E protease
MGPMVYSFRRKNDPTLYSLRALPIGGYNSIAGESYDDDDKLSKEQKMCYKPKWQRFLILIAGVTMNFLLAFILLFVIGLNGTTKQDNVIYQVEEGTPAAEAGLVPGDRIIKLNGHKIDTWNYLSVVSILKHNSDTYTYEVKHQDGSVQAYEITPRKAVQINDAEGTLIYLEGDTTVEKIVEERKLKKNEYAEVKIIGIVGSSEIKYGIKNALDYACKRFVTIAKSMLLILGSLFTGKLSLDSLSGPVGMYTVVKQASAFGFLNLLYLTAYLGINLGVMNAIPFPAFDGGHILFIFIELITGRRVNEKFESMCHLIGFILIFGLMIFITFKDIIGLFG